ncbi:MAG: DNA helicase RecG, partial [Candidatus Wildermuthbacteria bacterium]|nr:DNA helicase RecG [Candidatus Wildermuthbacteria bacterium]
RTLAMTIYGDLDLSLIKEFPKGRKNIVTRVVSPTQRERTYAFIRSQVLEGRQVFVVCPRIDPSDPSQKSRLWSEAATVKEEYKKLSTSVFPTFTIGILHGKLPSKEKERVMKEFKRGKVQILVSTSVVEVGVDIPNATVMLIEGAEYFGLAQLHQFRGRVGRGEHQSYCFLCTSSGADRRN